MKKILVFISLFLFTTFTVFADFSHITEIPTATSSAQILHTLDVLYGTENGLELERKVTRAEAVALLMRIHPEMTGAMGLPQPRFIDMDGHWAYKEVTYANILGLTAGTGNGEFTPDRIVTGREFARMTLCLLGYEDITTENSYDKAIEAELLLNNFSKKVVFENAVLTRSDVARICHGALFAKTNDGMFLKDKLCAVGKFSEEDFSVLGSRTPLNKEVNLSGL